MPLKGAPQAMKKEDALQTFSSSPQGLSVEEAKARLAKFGLNELTEKRPSKLLMLLRQFKSILVYILIAAAIITLLIGDVKDFAIILLLLVVNSVIGFWQEVKAEASIQALKKLTETKNNVLRDGQVISLSSKELVPGDVVQLFEGDLVTADLRILEETGLTVDESSITGESLPVTKDSDLVLSSNAFPYELANCLIAGTVITRGNAKALVTATGNDTYIASIAERAEEASPESPLTRALAAFSRRYMIVVVISIALLGAIALLQEREPLDVAYLLVAQLVSAVPEGLPLVITLVTVIGAMALSKRKTLTRYLPAVETLGSATVIATDKTGTITEGKLVVSESFALQEDSLRLCAALCNDSKDGRGDGVDVAIASWCGNAFEMTRVENPRLWSHPFDTKLRMMATFNQTSEGGRLFVKGAFESLKGIAQDSDALPQLEKELDRLAEGGMRVLAFGAGSGSEDPSTWRVQIVGLLGFVDPPKASVKGAVETAKKAGMRVVMITGDYPKTAKAIAAQVGIWQEGDGIITGEQVESMSDDDLCMMKNVTVMARVLPEHKYRLVKTLQSCGEIVTVTGDGVNDVPALRAADLGIAMGSGTEAAKSASKMVITDNDLGIIVEAIRTGRVIADNIRKVIYYLLSTNVNQLVLIGLSLLAFLPIPLLAIQILWINLVTDGVQDKTFPFAKEEGDVMSRRPKDPGKQFFDRGQLLRILFFAVTMGVVMFLLYILLLDRYSQEVAGTIIFTCVVVAQWVNGIQAQKEKEPFCVNIRRSFTINPYVYAGVAVGLLLQLAAIYLLTDWFSTVPMDLEQWYYVLLVALMTFLVIEVRKAAEYFLVVRRKKPQSEAPII
jgi:P-type Ca2+ transporter type 2C